MNRLFVFHLDKKQKRRYFLFKVTTLKVAI